METSKNYHIYMNLSRHSLPLIVKYDFAYSFAEKIIRRIEKLLESNIILPV
jgi:hypothetical protein